jgi:amidohydrolase
MTAAGALPMKDLQGRVDRLFDEVVDIRRAIHADPELGFFEHHTTGLIRDRLEELGLRDHPAGTATGAVAILDGGRPGRTVLLRADIDALPVTEEVDVPFRSRNDGVMHACGHDAHTAVLLGTAHALSAYAEELPGRYAFLFQPAEETLGGARAMIDGGVLDDLGAERVLSHHVASLLTTGLVGHRAGTAMSAAQFFEFHIHGAGGHGAMSARSGNVVLAASALASRLTSVVEGMDYEEVPCVCSAGLVHAGTASNVIPTRARVAGSLRTFTDDQHRIATERLATLCADIERDHQVRIDAHMAPAVPAVPNDPDATAVAVRGIAPVLGPTALIELPPMPPSDDVSEFLRRIPGTHLMIGAHSSPRIPPMHHAPDFAIDEESLRIGMLAMASAAVALAEPPPST